MSIDWPEGLLGDNLMRLALKDPDLFDSMLKDSMAMDYARDRDKFASNAMGLMCNMARELAKHRATLVKIALDYNKYADECNKQIAEANRINAESAAQWERWRNENKRDMDGLYVRLHDSDLALSEFKAGSKALSGWWCCVTDLTDRTGEELRRVGRVLKCAAEQIRKEMSDG